MKRAFLSMAILAACAALGQAQIFGRRATVRSSGDATVSVKPDQLKVNVGVTTLGATADAASSANAAAATKLLNALQTLVGSKGEIKTIGYSVAPNYKYPSGGGQPAIEGYTATNSLEVTTSDLSSGGTIIDTAISSGASNVQALRFGLKDSEAAQRDALGKATTQARLHADAMASALGLHVTGIISVQEGGVATPVLTNNVGLAAGASTPIQSGLLDVSATVVLEAELSQ